VITLEERAVVDPEVLRGKAVIRDTRIPVYLILKLLAAGVNMEDILKGYSKLKKEDIGLL